MSYLTTHTFFVQVYLFISTGHSCKFVISHVHGVDLDPSSLTAIGKNCHLCLHVVDIVSLKAEYVQNLLLTPHMVTSSRRPAVETSWRLLFVAHNYGSTIRIRTTVLSNGCPVTSRAKPGSSPTNRNQAPQSGQRRGKITVLFECATLPRVQQL